MSDKWERTWVLEGAFDLQPNGAGTLYNSNAPNEFTLKRMTILQLPGITTYQCMPGAGMTDMWKRLWFMRFGSVAPSRSQFSKALKQYTHQKLGQLKLPLLPYEGNDPIDYDAYYQSVRHAAMTCIKTTTERLIGCALVQTKESQRIELVCLYQYAAAVKKPKSRSGTRTYLLVELVDVLRDGGGNEDGSGHGRPK